MRYQPALDGLRAIAVLVVVLFHVNSDYLPGGWMGVDVFFVLSGYLITKILIHEQDKTGSIDLRKFYYFRALRLAPALFLLLIPMVILAIFSKESRQQHIQYILATLFYYMNWRGAFDLGGDLLGHTWSLSVEEQFYFIWPLFFIFLARKKNFGALLIGLVVAIAAWRTYLHYTGAPWYRTYVASDTHFDGLLIGCFVATLNQPKVEAVLSKSILIPIALLAWMAGTMEVRSEAAQTWGITASALLSSWILMGLQVNEAARKLLSRKLLVYTGRISYGWYLWHVPIFLMGHRKIPTPTVFSKVALYTCMFFASYAMAVLSYELVEKRFLKLKTRYRSAAPPAITANRSSP